MTMFTTRAEMGGLPRLLFGRQGYDLREQWISKGLLALAHTENTPAQARLFAFPDASDRFGLGPGMILAMRYWLRATGLMVEQRPGKRQGRKVPMLTPLGALLAQHDPYLERIGSLWLLHAHLAQNLLQAPTFSWFFQCFVGTTPFTKEACLDALLSWAIKEAPDQQIHPDALRRDLECLLRLYTVTPESPYSTPKHTVLASPFRRLQVLQCLPTEAGASDAGSPTRRAHLRYQFCPPRSEYIPALVILALVLQQNTHANQISLTHLLYGQQQPGRTCGLKREALVEALQWLGSNAPALAPRPITVEGQPWLELPLVGSLQVLLRYYRQP